MPTQIRPPAPITAIPGAPGGYVPRGPAGPPGLSAYQQWLLAGNVGTEAQFLASLAATAPKYRHDQAVPATTWTINHSLGFVPQIAVFSAGSVRLPLVGISNPTLNQSIITFNAATSGFALCQ